ncbi:hypothetical protein BC938DRAFT_471660 [Jimgerdemannia flammicorona]|uniref:Uncharacterized protein n=1 Tax=Jimgerdemannia flammicorona TaxID=994334 RepID=A0A433Q7N0_9FUNG|nr:hypothetical protein BC938DRAFT_471660 [Jimgerdemannia flammicorona]
MLMAHTTTLSSRSIGRPFEILAVVVITYFIFFLRQAFQSHVCATSPISPILRIPTLAIHLDHTVNEAFKFNTELQLTQVTLTGLPKADVVDTRHQQESPPPSKIKDLELCLYDTQGSVIGSTHK